MRISHIRMGMPVTVEVVDGDEEAIERVYDYFSYIDETFSTYKPESEISKLNRGALDLSECSEDVRTVLYLSERTQKETKGFFSIRSPQGTLDPSGLVKGWAINNAAELLRVRGIKNFYIEVGGDIATGGVNKNGASWRIGIRDPENYENIVKVVVPKGKGIVTSGIAARGQHIWNPHTGKPVQSQYLSLTVLGPNVYEADRFATAAYAMGEEAVSFIESLSGFEAFAILPNRKGIKTSGFHSFEV